MGARVEHVLVGGFVAMAVLILVTWFKGEHDSCMRSNNVRMAFDARATQLHGQPHVTISKLNCGFPFPDNRAHVEAVKK